METEMDAKTFQYICNRIQFDFGEGYQFRGLIPGTSEAWLNSLTAGAVQEDLPDRIYGNRVRIYTGGKYPRVVRLLHAVPTFDSGDREWDSYHMLYLICTGEGTTQMAYVCGGYRLASLHAFRELVSCPQDVRELLL